LTDQNIWDDLWGSPKKEEVPIKSSYNSVELAKYFQDKFIGAEWHAGFGMVNIKALAAQFAKWKTRTDSATVRAMIDLYMSDASVRGKNPGWTDFLGQAEAINAKLTAKPVKDKWDLIEEEWEREHGSNS
jgi:hypothetical protein